jgi:hypothetical protein
MKTLAGAGPTAHPPAMIANARTPEKIAKARKPKKKASRS